MCVHAKSLQSCPTETPWDCSLPGSSIHGILQARIMEWVAISLTRDLPNPSIELASLTSLWQVDSLPSELQGKPKNTGVGSLSLLQQILPTQESNHSPALQVNSLATELSVKLHR